ncbi:Spy/CpxP family protein refolding chaperone [Bradyrhizobium sp. LTSP849]|uniref:Spy/CpxP family protein refolding chaperone n=1 Tax=Bradyrhizobium sp. LTSP849 TaxID=1615890 RepID=UPI0032E4F284
MFLDGRSKSTAQSHSRPGRASCEPTNHRSAAESGRQFRGTMLTAAKLVEPALDQFHATLSSEQKATSTLRPGRKPVSS